MISCTVITKGAKPFLLSLFFISASFFIVAIEKDSIASQDDSLYNKQNDQVAGITSLMSAVVGSDVDGVRFFSKSGGSLINQKNAGGATALHLACREKNLEMVDILIKNGADVNLTDREGWTPLMRASLAKDGAIVSFLLANGAKAGAMNSIGESAIIHATSSDCAPCLTAIFEKLNFNQEIDIKSLKQQLSDAFVISRNHDNPETQAILESNLDKSIKAASLSSDSPNIDRNSKFKFVGATGEIVKESPISSPISESEKDIVVQDLSKYNMSNSVKDSANVVPVKAHPSKKLPLVTDKKAGKKFKFNQGPTGAKNKAEIEKAKIDMVVLEELPVEKPLALEVPQEKVVEETKKSGFFGLFSRKKSEEIKQSVVAPSVTTYSKEGSTGSVSADMPQAPSFIDGDLETKNSTDTPSLGKEKTAKVFKFNSGPAASAPVKIVPAKELVEKVKPSEAAPEVVVKKFKLAKGAEGSKVVKEKPEVEVTAELVEEKPAENVSQ